MHQRDENSKFFELYEVGLTEGKYEVSNQIHLDPKDIESDLARGNKASTSHNTLECPSGGVASATVTQAKDLADSSTDEYMGIDRTKIVKILALCNFALPMSYFCIGFIMSFGGTPLEMYIVNTLDASPAQLQVYDTVSLLPWSMKVFPGLLTDCVPIMGMRRKPYFVLGWLLFFATTAVLAGLQTPTLNQLLYLSFLSALGVVLADVAADSMIVERSRLEPLGHKGAMQSMAYVFRFSGSLLGQLLGSLVYNTQRWHWGMTIAQIFLVQALLPVAVIFPFLTHLVDPRRVGGVRSLKVQTRALWTLVQKHSVWQPMSFIAWYSLMQIPNAAWDPFLIRGLRFEAYALGVLSLVGSVCTWLGVTCYRAFFMDCDWRHVYIFTTLLGTVFSVLQLLLIFRVNLRWGIADLAFALGDDVMGDFIMAMQFLPMIVMIVLLCPDGAEGTSYALLTTLNNVANRGASNIGTLLTRVWDVSNGAMGRGDYSGLWKLTVLTSGLQLLGLLPVRLLPSGRRAQAKRGPGGGEEGTEEEGEQSSVYGGLGLVTFLLVTWAWTLIESWVVMSQ